MARTDTAAYGLDELTRETRMGALGSENRSREIRVIDLSDYEQRKAEIADQLWEASVESGFFQLSNHGISLDEITLAFAMTEKFFALPEELKARHPMIKGSNSGWESRKQIRPSTGTPDQKESYQITRPAMAGLWPEEEALPGFKRTMLEFEAKSWQVGMKVLSCFADKMAFDSDFFTRAHDASSPKYQSTLRMLHYFAIDSSLAGTLDLWRAGAHTDFDCLTLLYQREGQGGLQVCPGKDQASQAWTPIEPAGDRITCNIGDMLMRWSDDQLQSTFHRVKNPQAGEYFGPRYSLAFFCQANRDAIIQGPGKKYEPITAEDYLYRRINANFAKPAM